MHEEAGHTWNWFANKKKGTVHGKDVTANPELAALRSAHRVFLPKNNMMKLRKRPCQCPMCVIILKSSGLGKKDM